MFKGIYIDNFSSIIGIPKEEDNLLSWCSKHGFNEITLYSVAGIVANIKGCLLLSDFLAKAFKAGINVSVVGTNLKILTNEYEKYYKVYPNKFKSITTEYEFWNTGCSYTTFKEQLKYLQSLKTITNGNLMINIYLSQFEDAEVLVTDKATIAQRMVSSADKIFLVNYSNNAYNLSGTTLAKIKILAKAASVLNKQIDIVLLFNLKKASADPNIYDYCVVHDFETAFGSLKADYDMIDFSNKAFVNLIGYQYFNYSSASAARP
jgi:hypothetical protein